MNLSVEARGISYEMASRIIAHDATGQRIKKLGDGREFLSVGV